MTALASTRAERVAQARRLRDDGLLLREIAAVMSVAVQTAQAYLWDPDGSKSAARKASYAGACDTCGGPTTGSDGAAKAPTRCRECQLWTHAAAIEAFQGWADEHGGVPPTCANARADGRGILPRPSTVAQLFGSWNEGLLAAGFALHMDRRSETAQAILEAVRSGEPTIDIAERYGVTPSAIHERMRSLGTTVREQRGVWAEKGQNDRPATAPQGRFGPAGRASRPYTAGDRGSPRMTAQSQTVWRSSPQRAQDGQTCGQNRSAHSSQITLLLDVAFGKPDGPAYVSRTSRRPAR